jgi:hypothetical protein
MTMTLGPPRRNYISGRIAAPRQGISKGRHAPGDVRSAVTRCFD